MSKFLCRRCGNETSGLGRAPLPGPAGEKVRTGTCAECWQLWLGEQVKLMNENALTPVNQEHYDFLVGEMGRFLRLEEA